MGTWGGARPNSGPKPKDPARKAPPRKPGVVSRMLKVGMDALARSRINPRRRDEQDRPLHPFIAANHPPSVFPDGQRPTLAMDEAVNSSLAWAAQVAISGMFHEGLGFLGYPYLAELTQRAEYRVISETIATEATRKWIKVQSAASSTDQKERPKDDPRAAQFAKNPDRLDPLADKAKTEKIKAIVAELERLKVQDVFRRASEQDGFFGRSHVYIDVDNAREDREELKSPLGDGRNDLSKAKVKKGAKLRFRNVEPIWCYPSVYNAVDPLAPDWYHPEMWFCMGKELHVSRLMTFVGREVPDLLKPAYSFGGLSISQIAKPYVDNWLRTRQSVADIVHAFSVMVLSVDMGESLSVAGDELFRRLDFFNNTRDNRGVMAINKDTEDLKNVSAPLSSLDLLQAQSQEHMAAVSKIPIVKLLGIQPAGLNASSEGEIKSFDDTIAAYQGKFFGEPLKRVLGFVQLSLFGEIDEGITAVFEPLRQMTEKEIGEIDKLEGEADQIRIDSGVLHPEEARRALAAKEDSRYSDIDVEDVPDLAAEEEAGLEPEGGPGKQDAGEVGGDSAVLPFDLAFDAEWNESEHPRAPDGKFGEGGGGGAAAPLEVAKLKKVGTQKGSNPGGVYEGEGGKRYYVKQGRSADHVKNELLAARLYGLAGTPTLKYAPVEGGKHIATELEKLDKDNAGKLSPAEKVEAGKDFAVHAWLANWDAVGMGGDNIGTIEGQPTPLDLGGALAYRAQGAPKGDKFGEKVSELDSLRDPAVNRDSAKLFGAMTPAQLRESAGYVTQITDDEIKKAVEEFGGKAELAEKLIKRRDDVKRWAKTAGAAGDPKKPDSTVVFSGGSDLPVKELNGVKFEAWEPPKDEGWSWNDVDGQADLDEAPLPSVLPKGKRLASGLIVREPDGRVWIMRPKSGFGGYQGTFPKGRVEPSLSLQANAIKEAWEETGIKARVTGLLGDREGDVTVTRYYIAERESGDPSKAGEETDGVVLAPADKLEGFLNRKRDRDIAKELAKDAAFEESKHPRDPEGKFSESGSSGGGGGESEGAVSTSVVKGLLSKPAIAGGNYRRLLVKAIKQIGADTVEGATLKGKLIDSWQKTWSNAVKKGENAKADTIAKKIKQLGGSVGASPSAAPAQKYAAAPEVQKAVAAQTAKAAPVAKATPAELEKAKKTVALKLQYVPGAPQGSAEAQKLVDAFNDKYADKPMATQEQLEKKVADFKAMQAAMIPLMTAEQQKAAVAAKEAAEQNAKQAAAAAEKAKAEAEKKKAAEVAAAKALAAQNKQIMDELGISETEAYGFTALAKMMGGSTSDVINSFKSYEQQAKQYGYPITGFQAALIKNYTDGGYGHINAALRAGSWSAAQHVYAKLMNKALQQMPTYTGVVRRGTELSSQNQALYVVGNVVEERAFTSTSTATPFGGNTKFTITAIGKRGASVKKLSNHSSENEVVFSARTFFHVDKVEGKPGGQMHVHMTEVEGEHV